MAWHKSLWKSLWCHYSVRLPRWQVEVVPFYAPHEGRYTTPASPADSSRLSERHERHRQRGKDVTEKMKRKINSAAGSWASLDLPCAAESRWISSGTCSASSTIWKRWQDTGRVLPNHHKKGKSHWQYNSFERRRESQRIDTKWQRNKNG